MAELRLESYHYLVTIHAVYKISNVVD